MSKQLKYFTTYLLLSIFALVLLVSKPSSVVASMNDYNESGGETTFTNNWDTAVCAMSATPLGSTNTQHIDLGDDSRLEQFESVSVRLNPSDQHVYNFIALDCDGSIVTGLSRRLHRGNTYPVYIQRSVATIVNHTYTDVCTIGFTTPTGSSWINSLWPDGVLLPSEQVGITTGDSFRVRIWSCDGHLMVDKEDIMVLSGDVFSIQWGAFFPVDLINQPEPPYPYPTPNQPPGQQNQCPVSGKWPPGCTAP